MLTEDQKVLTEMIEHMEPPKVREVLDFAIQLQGQKLAKSVPLYDEEDLTDEDLQAIVEDSFRRSAAEHGDDEQYDYSDTWSEEDIEELRKSGLDYMEKVCPYDDDSLGGTGDAHPR